MFLWTDFMLAWESGYMNMRRERQWLSKNELQRSGEYRRYGFANGAGELQYIQYEVKTCRN